VVGIAIALNLLQTRGDSGVTMFAIIIGGWFSAELLSLLPAARQDGEA
jgi:hypothetical protein